MRFPFISRALYDDVVADLRKQRDDAMERAAQLTIENAHLAEQLAEANAPATARSRPALTMTSNRAGRAFPAAERLAAMAVDERLERALDNSRYKNNHRRRSSLRAWADKAVAAGRDVEDVAREIETFDKVEADDDVIAVEVEVEG